MSDLQPERLRVALVHHGFDGPAADHIRWLARALREAGHEPHVLASRVGGTTYSEEHGIPVVRLGRLSERRLRSRALDGPITHLPRLVAELGRGRFHVAHAFSPQEAAAARHARAGTVFTCLEAPRREALAARRLRLAFWERAVAGPSAVLVPGEEQREAVRRWLAVDAEVVDPADAAAHEAVYRRLLAP